MASKKLPNAYFTGLKRINGLDAIGKEALKDTDLSREKLDECAQELRRQIEVLNLENAKLMQNRDAIQKQIKLMKKLNSSCLLGVKYHFGADSVELKKVGGVRTSERKTSKTPNAGINAGKDAGGKSA